MDDNRTIEDRPGLALSRIVLIWLAASIFSSALAQDAAQISHPLEGSSTSHTSDSIQWNNAEGAIGYYLYVGTAPGLKDIVDSRETLSTQWPLRDVPTNRTVYARLFTKRASGWVSADTSFRLRPVATFVVPASDGQQLDVTRQRLTWNTVVGADAYYVYVGASAGSRELINTGEIQKTSISIASLPTRRTLWARLWTKHGGTWRYVDRSFGTGPVATFMTPVVHDTELDTHDDKIKWTTINDAEAYYLYIGSQPGANDVINTGEIAGTAVSIASLPLGEKFYARLWTKYDGVWRYVDSSFITRPVAHFLEPQQSPIEFDVRRQRISWTSVPNAQSYYLYVGTALGAKDLLNSGETAKTSVSGASLTVGATVYARLFTKHGGIWRHVDATFTTRPVAYIDNISDGQRNVDVRQNITWTNVQNATAYYLYIGSSPGAKDLVNSGEISSNSYPLRGLPGNVKAYVTLHTKYAGQWRSTTQAFVTAAAASFLVPAINDERIGTTEQQFQWNEVNESLGYRLLIGQYPGDSSLLDSGVIGQTSVRVPALPGGQQIHLRLGTLTQSGWVYKDSEISTRSVPAFQVPLLGAVGVVAPITFRWTPVSGASSYRIQLGDGVGRSNILDTSEIAALEYAASVLPPNQLIYARLSAKVNGTWSYVDSVFTTQLTMSSATMLSGNGNFDPGYGFEWTPVPIARSYRLEIGSAPGLSDIASISNLRTTRRIVSGLPRNVTLYGTLVAESYSDAEAVTAFSFTAGADEASAEDIWSIAKWAVGHVRGMATPANEQDPASVLAGPVDNGDRERANCTDYAAALRLILDQLGVPLISRILGVCLNPNQYDCHTLVEVMHPVEGVWAPLDPTFGLAINRAVDGKPAIASEVSAATRAQNWSAIEYEFLTSVADSYARNYWFDYPVLFANVYSYRGGLMESPPATILPYYDLVVDDIVDLPGFYAVQCPAGTTEVQILINGVETLLPCSSSDSLSRVFGASSVQPVSAGSPPLVIYRPRRFVF